MARALLFSAAASLRHPPTLTHSPSAATLRAALRSPAPSHPWLSWSSLVRGGVGPRVIPAPGLQRCMASSAESASQSSGVADEALDPTQQRLMFEDECILVDGRDQVVGHANKYNCHLMEKINSEEGGMLHRAFSVFLFDHENRLMLQQRAECKVTFPLVWTNTCCSHPLFRPDEMEEEGFLGVKVAARRKLEHELGISPEEVPLERLECIGRIHYKAPSDGKWGEHELDYLLFMKGTVAVSPNPNEVASVRYVTPDELRDLVRQSEAGEEGVSLSPWFKLVVDNFLYKWWDHLKEGTLDSVKDMDTIHKLL